MEIVKRLYHLYREWRGDVEIEGRDGNKIFVSRSLKEIRDMMHSPHVEDLALPRYFAEQVRRIRTGDQ